MDLEGGEYLISATLRIPAYTSNMQIARGSLVANPKSSTWLQHAAPVGRYRGQRGEIEAEPALRFAAEKLATVIKPADGHWAARRGGGGGSTRQYDHHHSEHRHQTLREGDSPACGSMYSYKTAGMAGVYIHEVTPVAVPSAEIARARRARGAPPAGRARAKAGRILIVAISQARTSAEGREIAGTLNK